ncbi:MarR family transcriptional regulator [Saccharothrix sp.]|uniref:MarR family transcriptional regulator n=1 Tax=Saccharothrix sp. TaxID=1873460 RepID=UPI0035C87400
MSPSATTSVPDRLESSGQVERTRSTADRRKVELRVNDRPSTWAAASSPRSTAPTPRRGSRSATTNARPSPAS